jgi:hypothetical protein
MGSVYKPRGRESLLLEAVNRRLVKTQQSSKSDYQSKPCLYSPDTCDRIFMNEKGRIVCELRNEKWV